MCVFSTPRRIERGENLLKGKAPIAREGRRPDRKKIQLLPKKVEEVFWKRAKHAHSVFLLNREGGGHFHGPATIDTAKGKKGLEKPKRGVA